MYFCSYNNLRSVLFLCNSHAQNRDKNESQSTFWHVNDKSGVDTRDVTCVSDQRPDSISREVIYLQKQRSVQYFLLFIKHTYIFEMNVKITVLPTDVFTPFS